MKNLLSTEKNCREEKMSLLTDIAELYYNREMSQSEIAEKLHISRSNVSRLLSRAKEAGIVEIKINYFSERSFQLEEALKYRFGLKDVFVFNAEDKSDDATLDMLTHYAADYISNNLQDNMCIGVTRGSVFAGVLSWLKKERPRNLNLKLVQLTGAEALSNPERDSGDLIRGMLQLYSGKAYYLNAPLYVENEGLREALEKEAGVSDTMQQASSCDIIITGVGYVSRDMDIRHSVWNKYLSREDVDDIVRHGGVGYLFFRFFDMEGRLIEHPVNARIIAARPDTVKKANVIAVAFGKVRARALLGALRQNVIKVLFVDRACAEEILYSLDV